MAAKTAKPQKKETGGEKAPSIQRGPGGRFVSRNDASVDARAAREPAVVIAQDVAARATAKEMPSLRVQTPAKTQKSWAERMLAWFRKPERTPEKAEMEAQMAAVKAGVMHELESIGVKKGVALKGSPFASVVLPVRKRKPYGRWALVAVLVVLVAVMLWVGGRKDTPDATMNQLGRAMATRDVKAFEKLVDLQLVSTDIVNQMFSLSPQDMLAVHTVLLMKPGMVMELQGDILAAVRGDTARVDSLPLRLKALLGGDALEVGRARMASQNDAMAVAEVPLRRVDLGLTLPLQVVLEPVDGDWVVVGVPNFTKVASSILQAEAAQAVRRAMAEQVAAPAASVSLAEMGPTNVTVMSLNKPEGNGNAMAVTATVRNTTEERLSGSVLRLEFGDAAQQPLLTLYLPVQGELAVDESRDMTWRVPVDTTDKRAVDVAKLPLAAMSVTATVIR